MGNEDDRERDTSWMNVIHGKSSFWTDRIASS